MRSHILIVLAGIGLSACSSIGEQLDSHGVLMERESIAIERQPLEALKKKDEIEGARGAIVADVGQGAPASPAAMSDDIAAYIADTRIQLPYPDAGVAKGAAIAEARIGVTSCEPETYGSGIRPERTVTVTAPESLDLMNADIVNALLIQALHVGVANCSYKAKYFSLPSYYGIKVLVVQGGVVAIETDRASPLRDHAAGFPAVRHYMAEHVYETKRAQQAALDSEKFWGNVSAAMWGMGLLGFVGFLLRYASVIATHIRWRLSPNAAFAEISRSTRRAGSVPVDGDALADALDFTPRNETEAKLARKYMEKMKARAEKEREYLDARAKLVRNVIDMERSRGRVEAHENRSTRHERRA